MVKMKNIVTCKNICLSYREKEVLKNLEVQIKEGDYYVLCGANGSGKSSFVKAILNLVPYEGEVIIFSKAMCSENQIDLLEDISVVFENPNVNLVCETVYDELKFPLKNRKYKKLEYDLEIQKIAKQLGIQKLLSLPTHTLSGGEKQLVSFASIMITKPKLLILDEPFTMVDGYTKDKLMRYIKKYHKDTKCTVIHITHDIEDILYGNTVGILKEGKIVYSISKEEFIQDDRIAKEVGLKLPFMADLSLKLKYYNLLSEPILDMNKMVKYLWK